MHMLDGMTGPDFSDTVDKCPFPHDESPHNKANDLRNDSKKLGRQLGPYSKEKVYVDWRQRPLRVQFQAHHVIPGQVAGQQTSLHPYIKKGSVIKGDIGYLQNDKRNGVWLPARQRGGIADKKRQYGYAYATMDQTKSQFHRWDREHKNYNEWVRAQFGKIQVKVTKLHSDCKQCCNKEKKWDPPYELCERLYDLAQRIRVRLASSPEDWKTPLCTSTFAAAFGRGVKPHQYTPE